MKYELTEETQVFCRTTWHRIRAKKTFANVSQGEIGGWIEKESNLDQSGAAWVSGDARVSGAAMVSGEARVSGAAHEKSPLYIQGTRHAITVNSAELVQIGCHGYPLSIWLKSFRAVGKKEGYSDAEFEEYGVYLRIISEILVEKKVVK